MALALLCLAPQPSLAAEARQSCLVVGIVMPNINYKFVAVA